MTSKIAPALLTLLAAGFALSACGGQKGAAGANDAPAKILPGSISDAMIDRDKSQTKPILAPGSEVGPATSFVTSGGDKAQSGDEGDAPAASASDAGATPSASSPPAPSPSAAPAAPAPDAAQ